MKHHEHYEAGSSMGIALEVALEMDRAIRFHNAEEAVEVYDCERRDTSPDMKPVRKLNPAQRAAFKHGFAAGRCSSLAISVEELAHSVPEERLDWLRIQLREIRRSLRRWEAEAKGGGS